MATEDTSGQSPRGQHHPSAGRRRIRKLGRAWFYLLLIAAPFAAGSRPTWALGALAAGWMSWFVLFLLPQYRRRGVGGRPWPALGLAAIGVWALIQGLWPHAAYSGVQWPPEGALSVDPWASLQQALVFFSAAVIFTGTAWLVDSSERIRALMLAVALAGALIAIVALALATGNGTALKGFAHYLPQFHTADTAVRATYSNQDRFSHLLLMTLPCVIGLWISLHFFSWRRDGPPTFHAISRDFRLTSSYTLYWLGITVTAATLILTGCRTSAVVATLSALGLMLAYGRGVLFKRRGSITFFAILALLIGQQVLFGFDAVLRRFANFDVSWADRLRGWHYAVELIGQRPFLGWGAGAFGDAVPHLPTYKETLLWNHAHNQYLEYAASLGLPFALALIAGVVWWAHEVLGAIRHLRSRRRVYVITILWAVCALLMVGLVDVPFYEPANLWILTALMGAAWGVAARPNEPLSPDEPPPSLLSWQEAHKAESALPFRPAQRLPAWALYLGLLPAGLGALALAALMTVDGFQEVRVREFIAKPLKSTDEHWDPLLSERVSNRWNARPLALAATLGLERHFGGAISPGDQLFDPPVFSPELQPSRTESPYRIRRNLMRAIRLQPLNGDLYFQLALLDFVQRQPSSNRTLQILPGLHHDLLVDLLKRLEPDAAKETVSGWIAADKETLVQAIRAHPEEDVVQGAIAEELVLPKALTDWRIQCMRHLTVASDYSRGFDRMQLFCAFLRLHLWHEQNTGDAELQKAMGELHTAFAANAGNLTVALPLLFFFRLDPKLIDQTIPDTPACHTAAAASYRQWGYPGDAMRHLEAAGEAPELALFKGALHLQEGDADKAARQFQLYLDQPAGKPAAADSRTNRAGRIFAEWRQTEPEAALRFWQAQAEKYPNEKCWPLFLGYTYDRLGNQAQAYEYLSKAAESNDSEGLRLRLAALAPGPESKIQHLRKVLVFRPDNLYARASLVLVLKAKGDNSYQLEREMLSQSLQGYRAGAGDEPALPEVVQRALHTP